MSTLLWKEAKQTDGKRFVESVACSGGSSINTQRISVPLLVGEHAEQRTCRFFNAECYKESNKAHFSRRHEEYVAFYKNLGVVSPFPRLTQDDDMSEADVFATLNGKIVSAKDTRIRDYSYANLLYKQVRCAFVHEYKPGENAVEDDPSRVFSFNQLCHVSYVSRTPDKERVDKDEFAHLIFFPLDWIASVALSIAAIVDSRLDLWTPSGPDDTVPEPVKFPLPRPGGWWIENGLVIPKTIP